MVLLFPNEAKAGKFARESFPDLPSTIIYGIDTDGIAAQIAESMKLKHKESLPYIHHSRYFQSGGLCIARIHHRTGRTTDEDNKGVIGLSAMNCK